MMAKAIFRSRTVWYAIAIAVLSVLQGFVQFIPFTPAIQAVIGCFIAIGIVVLRFLTTTPLVKE